MRKKLICLVLIGGAFAGSSDCIAATITSSSSSSGGGSGSTGVLVGPQASGGSTGGSSSAVIRQRSYPQICANPDRSDRKFADAPQGRGKVVEAQQTDSCAPGSEAVKRGNTLVCFSPPVDVSEQIEKMFKSTPDCLPGATRHNNACYTCPSVTIRVPKVGGHEDKTIGTSWVGDGKCEGQIAGIKKKIDALRTNLTCNAPPNMPPPVMDGLPVVAGSGVVKEGKCYAKYAKVKKKKVSAKILGCENPPPLPGSTVAGIGELVKTGPLSATCRVKEGIVRAIWRNYTPGPDANGRCNAPGNNHGPLFCDGTYSISPSSCCRDIDWKAEDNQCKGKFQGEVKDGYYKPFSSNSRDVIEWVQ